VDSNAGSKGGEILSVLSAEAVVLLTFAALAVMVTLGWLSWMLTR
jgi:hypothetical protein